MEPFGVPLKISQHRTTHQHIVPNDSLFQVVVSVEEFLSGAAGAAW